MWDWLASRSHNTPAFAEENAACWVPERGNEPPWRSSQFGKFSELERWRDETHARRLQRALPRLATCDLRPVHRRVVGNGQQVREMVAHAEFGQAMRAVAAEFCGATGRGARAVLKPAFPLIAFTESALWLKSGRSTRTWQNYMVGGYPWALLDVPQALRTAPVPQGVP
jgi:hypothetical protein